MIKRLSCVTVISVALLVMTLPAQAGSVIPLRCSSSQLMIYAYLVTTPVTPGDPQVAKIVFYNTSSTSCSLAGNPGVAAIKNGRRVGQPATWAHPGPKLAVTLAPGGEAHAVLKNTGTAHPKCRPTRADAIDVYAPNTATSQSFGYTFGTCASLIPNLRVGVVKPGRGV